MNRDYAVSSNMIPLSSGSDFKPAPAGPTNARCVRIIDLGTQRNATFNKSQRKILFGFECPDLKIEEGDAAGKPHLVYQRFTASLAPKGKLRPFIEGWFGKAITGKEQEVELSMNLHKLLGRFALISIVHSENGEFANIAFASKPMAGFDPRKYGPPVNKPIYLSLDPESFDRAAFNELTDGIKKAIMDSPEWRVINGDPDPGIHSDHDASDVPTQTGGSNEDDVPY